MQKCKECRRPVRWVTMAKTGRKNPLDVDPDRERGNVLIIENERESRAFDGAIGRAVVLGRDRAARARAYGRELFVSHWATCPEAAKVRERVGRRA